MIRTQERLRLFPDSTRIEDDRLTIAGLDLARLAERFGTPLYVYDRLTMDSALQRYRDSLKAHYPGAASIAYAAKAFWCKALAQWVHRNHLWADCSGEAEIEVAAISGLPRAAVVVHGTSKSDSDLTAAIRHAATVVIDSVGEVSRLARLMNQRRPAGRAEDLDPSVWLRFQPGIAVRTHHEHTQTGQVDSKFGMTAEECLEAANAARVAGMHVNGLHFHLGSNFRDTQPMVRAVQVALDLASRLRFGDPWHFSPGGGWGAAYTEDELPQPDIDGYIRLLSQEVARRCRRNALPLPILHIEPGRSLVARAGVSIYRIGGIKRRKHLTWLLVDGGMADNPRPAMYGAAYSCLPVQGLRREMKENVSIGGPYCESGDVLIRDLSMPPMEAGELIAIPVSGAYQLSMASNYNGAPRPAAIWIEKGQPRLIVRREMLNDLLKRDALVAASDVA